MPKVNCFYFINNKLQLWKKIKQNIMVFEDEMQKCLDMYTTSPQKKFGALLSVALLNNPS